MATGRSQQVCVLHQVLLVVRRAPDGAEGALLVSPSHPGQADHGGSQQEDQDHHEQPRQDHHWGRESSLSNAGMRTATGRVGPPTALRARTSSPCARHPATRLVRVWELTPPTTKPSRRVPTVLRSQFLEKEVLCYVYTNSDHLCSLFYVCVFHPYSTLYFPPRLGQPVQESQARRRTLGCNKHTPWCVCKPNSTQALRSHTPPPLATEKDVALQEVVWLPVE